jgi:hypothetical protein
MKNHIDEKTKKLERAVGANPDPITGKPGSHPVGTGVGSARNVSMKVRQIRFAFSDSRMSRSWSFPVVGLGHAEGAATLQAG